MVEEENKLELILCSLDELREMVAAAIGHKPKLLDVEAAAQYLGLRPSYMNKLRNSVSGPPYIKIGDCVRYNVDDLNKWIKEKERRGKK